MATKYWIKLYHETLHDPKVARLPDNLWRRFIECLLFAGEENDNGRLPPSGDMSWTLQRDEETLIAEFDQLARYGLLDHRTDNVLDNGYWLVVNFGKRQMPLTKADYMQRLRDGHQKEEHYGYVTKGNAETDKEEDKDKEIDAAAVFSFYQNNFTMMTSHIADKINEELDESPPEWIMDAMKISLERGHRNWGYVAGILRNWHTKGKDNGKTRAKVQAQQLGGQFAE